MEAHAVVVVDTAGVITSWDNGAVELFGHDAPAAIGQPVDLIVPEKRLGARLGSGATAGEGAQNLLCAAQAAAVLIGLAVTAAYGWSWADPAVALLLAAWAIREGIEAWRGEDCC